MEEELLSKRLAIGEALKAIAEKANMIGLEGEAELITACASTILLNGINPMLKSLDTITGMFYEELEKLKKENDRPQQ